MIKTCLICNKEFKSCPSDNRKYCSRNCADIGHSQLCESRKIIKTCPVCGNTFKVTKSDDHPFCSVACGAIGKAKPHVHNLTPAGRKVLQDKLIDQWKDSKFRAKIHDRMINNNPSHDPVSVAKACKTRETNHSYRNNFKYGNGKISEYEQKVYNKLVPLGFLYNHPINTRAARDKYPEAHYASAYKPDFVNIDLRVCIEIDGYGHATQHEQTLDAKKTACLNFLGFDVIRFSHQDIDNGRFDEWLNSYLNNI